MHSKKQVIICKTVKIVSNFIIVWAIRALPDFALKDATLFYGLNLRLKQSTFILQCSVVN